MRCDFWRTAKVPKRRQLHCLALGERAADFFQHVFDHLRRIRARKPDSLENGFRQISAR
jgi:hypothetical protein